MMQSRRNILAVFGAAVGCAAAGQLASVLAEGRSDQRPFPQPKPSPNAPQNQNSPLGLDGQPISPAPRQGDVNRQTAAALRLEVDKLCAMANELKEDVMRANPRETLSIAFVKKAQAIEKLARQIKDQAKG